MTEAEAYEEFQLHIDMMERNMEGYHVFRIMYGILTKEKMND